MQKFFKRNELSKLLGINSETLRFYEKIELILSPSRASNGYRLYTEKHLEELRFIQKCRSLGFSLDEIKQLKYLKAQSIDSCKNIDNLVNQHLDKINQKIEHLNEIKTILLNLQHHSSGNVEDCKIVNYLK